MKNTHGGELILVKLQASAWNGWNLEKFQSSYSSKVTNIRFLFNIHLSQRNLERLPK